MSVIGIFMRFSVTISKKFINSFEVKIEATVKDLIELFIVMSCLAVTGACGSRSRHNEHMTDYTMK